MNNSISSSCYNLVQHYIDNPASSNKDLDQSKSLTTVDLNSKDSKYFSVQEKGLIEQYNARAKSLNLPKYGESASAYDIQQANSDPNLSYFASQIDLIADAGEKSQYGLGTEDAFHLKQNLMKLDVSYWESMQQYVQDNDIQDPDLLSNIQKNLDSSKSQLTTFNHNARMAFKS